MGLSSGIAANFFEIPLGPHLKYSSAYFPPGVNTLGDAEAAMLALSVERAEFAGQRACGFQTV